MCISETWLHEAILDSELEAINYNIFRNDRESRGGGILIAVKETLQTKVIKIPNLQLEFLGIKINVNNKNIYILLAYLPPPVNASSLLNLEQILNQIIFESEDIIILLGDFNLSNPTQMETFIINNFCNEYNLTQNIDFPTRGNNFLDLVFSNHSLNCCATPAFFKSDHVAIEITLLLTNSSKPLINKINHVSELNFFKTDYSFLNELLSITDWDMIFNTSDVNITLNYFYEIFHTALTFSTPLKSKKTFNKFHPWFDANLKKELKLKNKLHSMFKCSKNNDDLIKFQIQRKKFKALFFLKKNRYIKSIEDDIPNNTKTFWSYISKNKKSNRIPQHLTYRKFHSDNVNGKLGFFQEHFTGSFNNSEIQDVPSLSSYSNDPVDLPTFSQKQVEDALNSLDNNKFTSPDSIPSSVLKSVASNISYPLHKIFNISLQTSTYPDLFKLGYVIPIFKKGNKEDVENYRPITITSHISKIFEKLIHSYLYSCIKSQLSSNQHGFFPTRSTSTNLLQLSNMLANELDSGNQVDVIYFDLRKAFDSVLHKLLIKKLRMLNLSDSLIDWFISYLYNRICYILLEGETSSGFVATSGVPQGSILGPLLFNIFINDLTSIFESLCLLFADDLKLYAVIKSISDAVKLQSDINKLLKWCATWGIDINIKKCVVMSYHNKKSLIKFDYMIGDTVLERVEEVTDLGVCFDKNLSFKTHIEKVIKKASQNVGFLKRMTSKFKNPKTILTLYKTMTRPLLEYCSAIWSPYTKKDSILIESIQKKFLRYLIYKFKLPNVEPFGDYLLLCQAFEIEPLIYRRQTTDLSLFHKILHKEIDCPSLFKLINFNSSSVSLRHRVPFQVPRCHGNLKKNHFFSRTQVHINNNKLPIYENLKQVKTVNLETCFAELLKKISHNIV